MASSEPKAGPGPGKEPVPPASIVLILVILMAAAVANMWTLGNYLGQVPNWEVRNDTLAVAAQPDTSARTGAVGAPSGTTDTSAARGTASPPESAQRPRNQQQGASSRSPARTQDAFDLILLRIVLLAGALGGLLHAIRSFAWYVGNRDLVWSWVPTYLTLPIVGALLAAVMYLVVRAGFVGFAGPTQPSPYGFAAASALVGLFSQAAILKLKEVAETLFKKPDSGADSRPQDSDGASKEGQPLKDSAAGLAPVPVVSAGSVTRENGTRVLHLDGSGFRPTSALTVDRKPVPVAAQTSRRMSAALPDDVARGATTEVTVTTPPPGGGSSTKKIDTNGAR